MTRIKAGALFLAVLFSVTGTSFADDGAFNAMQDQIRTLNQQLADVEKKLSDAIASGSVGAQQSGYVAPAAAQGNGLLKAAEDIQVGGQIDVQYNQNLTRRDNAITGGNTGRIFDTDRQSFTLNQAELNFRHDANPEGGAGFRVDLSMGEDAGVVAADGFAGDNIDLQQGYLEYVQPLSFWEGNEVLPSSVSLKAGRFVTLAGAEVIEPQDNWNLSRSFAFGLAIPFVHTGVRTNFKLWKDFFDVYAGVNNGWGNAVDNNSAKTWEFGLGYSPIEKVSVFHSLYWGNENASTGYGVGGARFLSSNVVKFEATDKLAFMYELNIGNQIAGATLTDEATWVSNNFYGRYQLTPKDALAYRFEIFHDSDAFISGISSKLWGHTITYERKLSDNLLSRAEYRYDHAQDPAPYGGGTNNDMQTISAEMVYVI